MAEPVRADWRDCFDCGDFILLPRQEVLERIQSFQYKHRGKPEAIARAIPWEERVNISCFSLCPKFCH